MESAGNASEQPAPVGYLHDQIQALEHQAAKVRENAPDGVHRMRVATRRLRSVLGTYRTLFDAETAGRLRGELKWLAGVLGRARDAQVMGNRLRQLVSREPSALVLGPVSLQIEEELATDFRKAHTESVAALDSERYSVLVTDLSAMVPNPLPSGSRRRRKVSALISNEGKRLRRTAKAALKQQDEKDRAAVLHEVRKRAKRLRYAAEAAADSHGKRAVKVARSAQRLQKILGDHQDSAMSRDLLRRLGVEAHLQGNNGFTFGRLHALEQHSGAVAEERFLRAWKKFPSSPLMK